jgi:hypothetical protein
MMRRRANSVLVSVRAVRAAFGEGHELEGQLDEVVACYAVIRGPWEGIVEGVVGNTWGRKYCLSGKNLMMRAVKNYVLSGHNNNQGQFFCMCIETDDIEVCSIQHSIKRIKRK